MVEIKSTGEDEAAFSWKQVEGKIGKKNTARLILTRLVAEDYNLC